MHWRCFEQKMFVLVFLDKNLGKGNSLCECCYEPRNGMCTRRCRGKECMMKCSLTCKDLADRQIQRNRQRN